ncbi:MAG: hypothetical protein IT248_02965 [Chitinophagaceae bacterium]|nr:hypothetical protein [Chitinophagaceae bacterium]
MIVKTNPADTSFSFLCDWQYSILNFSTNTITDTTAEKFALFFMVLDKNTFGHQNFNIQDKRLFNGNTNYSDTANIERKIAIEPAQASGRASLLASICYNTTVITVHENWHCTQSGLCVSGVCDECALCVDYSFSYHTEVHCFDEEVGGPPSGGGGTGGGGGGTGTPPECGGGLPQLRGQVQEGCTPGWNPNTGGIGYDPDLDPASYPETPEILLFEQDYRGQMSTQELAIFDNMPRIKQLQYLFNAKSALDWAQSIYPTSVHNGNGDAFRHAYFSAMNAKVLGVHLAKQLGDAHETFPNNNPIENQMDLFNNQYGRNLFVELSQNGMGGHFFKESVILLLKNIRIPNGELRKIAPLGPNSEILPSSQLVPTD